MFKLVTNNKIIFFTLLVAAVLRLWNLGGNPPHLTPDEAALGYNAYSILKTGRDEHGQLLPFVFTSFGDYKPGLYIYSTVPSIAVFGLTEFATRFPNAMFGILAVYLLYLIVTELFPDKKRYSLWGVNISFAEISAFLLAINPWHIHFSRGAWEVNLSLTLTLAGVYFFLKSFEHRRFLMYSAAFFGISLFAYQGAKLSTVIVVLLLVGIYFRRLMKFDSRELGKAFLVGFIFSLPILLSLFRGQTGRLAVFSIFTYPRPIEYLEAQLNQGGELLSSASRYYYHPENVNFLRGIAGRWFNHFSTRFLFFQGDWANQRHSAPNHGVLLLSDLLILSLGFIALVRSKKTAAVRFIWLWLILAPLPAALSRDQVHAVRSYNLVIPITVILAFGVTYALDFAKRQKFLIRNLSVLVLIGSYLTSYAYFLDAYFVHLPKHDSKYWDYGYKQLVEIITPIQGDYDLIRVQQSFAQPYIFFLFYQKYDPAAYQKQSKLTDSGIAGDVGYQIKLDNIEFVPIDWAVQRKFRGVLFAADTIRIPPEDSSDENLFEEIAVIKYLDGQTFYRVIEAKE